MMRDYTQKMLLTCMSSIGMSEGDLALALGADRGAIEQWLRHGQRPSGQALANLMALYSGVQTLLRIFKKDSLPDVVRRPAPMFRELHSLISPSDAAQSTLAGGEDERSEDKGVSPPTAFDLILEGKISAVVNKYTVSLGYR